MFEDLLQSWVAAEDRPADPDVPPVEEQGLVRL